VRTKLTDPAAIDEALRFVRLIDKLPLPVNSAPGFLVNAVLGPYLHEAMRALDEGIPPEAIDCAATDFGMPLGPIELIDTVGLDIALAAGRALTGAMPPGSLTTRVAAGHLGQKTGQGFYRWQSGRPQKRTATPPPDLARRLIAPLLTAAQRCLDEGVVQDAELIDAGVIFGTGFAPWTGGPLYFTRKS
jgi:3-hydroxyacyl-CoA dehydrogenase/enoyl-CoA hydratase/3-hydroxybutyryl-CoA epimerase